MTATSTSGMRDIAATAKLKAGLMAAEVVKYGTRSLDQPGPIGGKTRRDLPTAVMPSATNRVTPP